MNNIQKLGKLLSVINDLFSIGDYGVNHIEFLFIDVKKLLEENIDTKKYFFKKLMDNIEQDRCLDIEPWGYVDSDLLCYLAYTTRWQEFYDFIGYRKNIIGAYPKDRVTEDIADAITIALRDDWEDTEFYNMLDR